MDRFNRICSTVAAGILATAPVAFAPQAQAASSTIALPLTTNVNVTNSTLTVQSADNPAFTQYTETGASGCGTKSYFYQFGGATHGQTLVLETVSVSFSLSVGSFPSGGVALSMTSAAGPVTVHIPAVLQGSDGINNFYVATQALRTYNVGGTNGVTAKVVASNNAGNTATSEVCLLDESISGYLVNGQ